jgi:hypothetical protein
MVRASTRLPLPITYTCSPSRERWIAAAGTTGRLSFGDVWTVALTNCPGSSRCFGFGKSA